MNKLFIKRFLFVTISGLLTMFLCYPQTTIVPGDCYDGYYQDTFVGMSSESDSSANIKFVKDPFSFLYREPYYPSILPYEIFTRLCFESDSTFKIDEYPYSRWGCEGLWKAEGDTLILIFPEPRIEELLSPSLRTGEIRLLIKKNSMKKISDPNKNLRPNVLYKIAKPVPNK